MFYFRMGEIFTLGKTPRIASLYSAAAAQKGCLNACCTMTRHLLALVALGAAGAAACDMCSVHCDGCEMLEPTCSGLSQKDKDRWREWQEFGSLCENDVCCASDEEDCCEPNVGAIAGLVVALVLVVGGSIYAYRKYEGGKGKEPDEDSQPDSGGVATGRAR